MKNTRILYLCHGGGPLPLLGDGQHDELVAVLKDIVGQIERPSRILLISAHWEETVASITAAQQPRLMYDYYGFPEEAYRIAYPAPGDRDFAERLSACLERSGLANKLDSERPFDHGMYIPLTLMYPDADIPCVQLSLLESLDASAHLALGEALAGLDEDNLLIIGSGFSFHNMRAYLDDAESSNRMNRAFDDWLCDTLGNKDLNEQERRERLGAWLQAPYARYCHPREEHLLPLHVCYGAAGRVCENIFRLTVFDKRASMFLW